MPIWNASGRFRYGYKGQVWKSDKGRRITSITLLSYNGAIHGVLQYCTVVYIIVLSPKVFWAPEKCDWKEKCGHDENKYAEWYLFFLVWPGLYQTVDVCGCQEKKDHSNAEQIQIDTNWYCMSKHITQRNSSLVYIILSVTVFSEIVVHVPLFFQPPPGVCHYFRKYGMLSLRLRLSLNFVSTLLRAAFLTLPIIAKSTSLRGSMMDSWWVHCGHTWVHRGSMVSPPLTHVCRSTVYSCGSTVDPCVDPPGLVDLTIFWRIKCWNRG